MDTISVAAATILTGLSAGLLYGWRVSVIPGTSQTSSHAYVETMQSINRAILNPAFFLVFLGAPVAIAVATVFSFVDDANARAGLLAFAFVLYLTTTVVTTAVGNIPLNGHLEAFDARGATGAEVDAARVGYERPWNRWHDVRTVSSASAFVLCVLAAFVDVS
ncbi:MAG TPA: DUF1772 domain-containing protein [Acidimicrobiaceae bacterium]|nr:DUF1772 domain-containing protein [Acidimicrobiaceae bacterium]